MFAHSRSAFGLAMVMVLMLITSACNSDGVGPTPPPPPPPPAKTISVGVWTEDGNPVPDGTTVTITDKNGARTAPVVGNKAEFVLDPKLVGTGGKVSLYVSGSSAYYPSYTDTMSTAILEYIGAGAVLVPSRKCLTRDYLGNYEGVYAGACGEISLPKAFGLRPAEWYSGFFLLGRIGGIKFPMKVAFENTVSDTSVWWTKLKEMSTYIGVPEMFVPADSPQEVVDTIGPYNVQFKGFFVRSGAETHASSEYKEGMLSAVVLTVSSGTPQDLMMTYLWRALGPIATCEWPSVTGCSSGGVIDVVRSMPTLEDVLYTRAMLSAGNGQYEHKAQLGFAEALAGYNHARENNLPRPSL